MSVFLTAQEKPRPPRRTSKLSRAKYALRIPRIFFRQNPEYPQIAPHAGKKIYVGSIETLGSLSLYLCSTPSLFSPCQRLSLPLRSCI